MTDVTPHVVLRFNGGTTIDVRFNEGAIPIVTITQDNNSIRVTKDQLRIMQAMVDRAVEVLK